MNKSEVIQLAIVLKRIESFSFSDTTNVVRVAPRSMHQPPADVPLKAFVLPIEGQQTVGDFIKQRTELWRESWVIPQLRALVEKYAAKHGIDLSRVQGS